MESPPKLLIQIPGAGSFEVFPESAERLFARSTDFHLTIVKDDKGRVTHVLIRREGLESKWMKSP